MANGKTSSKHCVRPTRALLRPQPNGFTGDASTEDLTRLLILLNDDDFFLREAAAWPISELAGPSSLRDLLIAY